MGATSGANAGFSVAAGAVPDAGGAKAMAGRMVSAITGAVTTKGAAAPVRADGPAECGAGGSSAARNCA